MVKKSKLSPKVVIILVLTTIFFHVLFYFLGKKIFDSKLSFYEFTVFDTILIFVVIGGYQLFFWVQKNNYYFKTRCLKTKIDNYIPFIPEFVWIYSLIYYLAIGFTVVTINSIEEGMYLIFAGIILLFTQLIFFILFPCKVPKNWRNYEVNSLSTKYLNLIQKLDNGRNCFPSKHCSLATLVGLILFPTLSYFSIIFVILIVISCLFVKQHQILDTFPGVLLGYLVWFLLF